MKIIVVGDTGTPHEISVEDKPDFDVLAKRSGNRFLVLASREGDLFDPLNSSHSISKRDRERGGLFWRLSTCSQECFSNYTSFLRSRHRTPYIFAQRRFNSDI